MSTHDDRSEAQNASLPAWMRLVKLVHEHKPAHPPCWKNSDIGDGVRGPKDEYDKRPTYWPAGLKRWMRELERTEELSPCVPLSAEASATPAFVAPMQAYRTHAQRMSTWYRKLDKANAKRMPLRWEPISEERAEKLKEEWSEKRREVVIAVAQKRGDIIPALPNIVQSSDSEAA